MRSEKQLSILNPRRGSLISVLFPIIPEGRRGDALGQELIIKCLFFPSVSFCFLLFPSVSFLISSTNRKEICRRREIKRPLQRAREREKRGGTRRNLTFSNWNTSFFSFYFFSIKERFLCDSEKRREEYQLSIPFPSITFLYSKEQKMETDGNYKKCLPSC